MRGIHKDWKPLVRELRRAGYKVKPGSNHHRILNKNGKFVAPLATTPSDHRALKNQRAQLRRNGIL